MLFVHYTCKMGKEQVKPELFLSKDHNIGKAGPVRPGRRRRRKAGLSLDVPESGGESPLPLHDVPKKDMLWTKLSFLKLLGAAQKSYDIPVEKQERGGRKTAFCCRLSAGQEAGAEGEPAACTLSNSSNRKFAAPGQPDTLRRGMEVWSVL